MADIQFQFTSNLDGTCHVAPIPRDAFTACVERALLRAAPGHGEGETLCARVEPAFLDGGDDAIAFAVVTEEGEVIGTIPRDAFTLAGAASDAWERHLVRAGRDLSETATYVLRRADATAPARAASGVRVMQASSDRLEYSLTVPAVHPLDLARAVTVGTTGAGVVERVFDAEAFAALRRCFLGDPGRERMAALHGRLWFTPNDKGDLVAYVLYEDFIPLEGEATISSVHIEAAAQGASAGHELPLAALIHSHPFMQRRLEEGGAPGGGTDEEDLESGAVSLSSVDLVQFRRALPHVHQATIVAGLPAQRDGLLRLAVYGYGAAGAVQAEPGFWIAAAACRGSVKSRGERFRGRGEERS